jgi:hypothetical protein
MHAVFSNLLLLTATVVRYSTRTSYRYILYGTLSGLHYSIDPQRFFKSVCNVLYISLDTFLLAFVFQVVDRSNGGLDHSGVGSFRGGHGKIRER